MNPGLQAMNTRKYNCTFCGQLYTKGNLKRHEKACKKNPANERTCPVCGDKYTKKSATCSYSCSNTYFRSGLNNGNANPDSYRTICFHYHKKECIVCGENKIVAVHHLNEDHEDNRLENLVPLCPTHHSYVHSKYKNEIMPFIEQFISV